MANPNNWPTGTQIRIKSAYNGKYLTYVDENDIAAVADFHSPNNVFTIINYDEKGLAFQADNQL